MTLKSMAQMNTMSSMGSNEAEHLRTISSLTFTSESSGTSVRLVASEEKVLLLLTLLSSQTTRMRVPVCSANL